jgi:hypothetical protein
MSIEINLLECIGGLAKQRLLFCGLYLWTYRDCDKLN